MNQADIEKAFAKKVDTFCSTLIPVWGFADSDMDYKPEADKPYMLGASVMSDPYNAAIAAPKIFTRQNGFYQITLHYPIKSNNPRAMRDVADSLRRAFFDDAARTVGGTSEIIDVLRMPRIDRMARTNTHIRCCVTVYFTAESPVA